MTRKVIEMNPVSAITAGAVGEPGNRVFYIQARTPAETATLLAEKTQVQALARGIYQVLSEIDEKFAKAPQDASTEPFDLELQFPLEPDFRVERMELGYEPASDLIVLVAYEISDAEQETGTEMPPDELSVARFHATRAQMQAMADHALDVAERGRPICRFCGLPDDGQSHVCPKRNGHLPTQATL